MASPQISLKLLVNKKGARVLFAEVPKEFMDFLFQIFSLPLGTVTDVLGSNQMVGSIGKLKDSLQSFPQNYLQPGIKLDGILNPKAIYKGNAFVLSDASSSKDRSGASNFIAYRCANERQVTSVFKPPSLYCSSYMTMHPNCKCPACNDLMNVKMTVVVPNIVKETEEADTKEKGGYVKEVVTYMVTDDLKVKPMSAISCITLINQFGIEDVNQLEEKTVTFGKDEALKLLNASFKTDQVLTTMFMR